MYLENLGRGRVEEVMPHVGGSRHILTGRMRKNEYQSINQSSEENPTDAGGVAKHPFRTEIICSRHVEDGAGSTKRSGKH